MQITLNGKPINLADKTSVKQLLEKQQMVFDFNAVAINQKFIPRSEYQEIWLQDNDVVEVLTPMQGG